MSKAEKEIAIQQKIADIQAKYESMGQDMGAYLDGLLYANPVSYWNYVKTDVLLNIQNPITDFPDEQIFIVYHQITELYFKLALHEIEQIANNGKKMSPIGENLGWNKELCPVLFTERLKRINNYFEALTKSFEIMIHGMEKEQFLKFRMSLLPASGFQSAQYRKIEICSTEIIHIVNQSKRAALASASLEAQFEHIYWKEGATEIETGKKTLTLLQFEEKYLDELFGLASSYKSKNLWVKFKELELKGLVKDDLRKEMRQLDVNVNVNWPLVHYKTAARYLGLEKGEIPATGGTNWQKYLPPRFQKRIFYPELWSAEEKENWGKYWVDEVFAK